MTRGIEGRALVEGDASGTVLRLEEPLSFWGGLDSATGQIVDRRHPDFGTSVTGKVLAMPSGRGSSSSSSVLAEAIRADTGPVGIVMTVPDGIVALGALVATELYGVVVPVMVVTPDIFESIPNGASAVIRGARLSWSSRSS